MPDSSSPPAPGDRPAGESAQRSSSIAGGSPIEAAYLRSALEFAVMIAREGQKVRPRVPYPAKLKRYLSDKRLTPTALVAVRNIVEENPDFRERLAAGALPELVDPIGRLWIERPKGWRAEVDALIAQADEAARSADANARLKRAEKQRDAAQAVATRLQADVVMSHDRIAELERLVDDLRAEVVKADDEATATRAELIDTRNELRHAHDRESAAIERATAAEASRVADESARRSAEQVRDGVLADRAALAAERAELARLAKVADELAGGLADLWSVGDTNDESPPASGARTPLRLPGGVMGDSSMAAKYLLRSEASVIIDGYNVAKLAWPDASLVDQRQRLLDATENVARRYGSDLTVVFDGADVVGASASGRRLIRVVYSSADVIADDVIRDEVDRLPPRRPVVVITNDQAIVRDVRAAGANTMTSDQLIELFH